MKQLRHLLISVFIFSFSINAFSTPTSQPKYKVIIVGAGIAGLTAAKTLTDAHIPVLVLEARNRIGGRIYTVHPWVKNMDLGAGWIHGIYNNPIADISNSQHLKTTPTLYNDNRLYARFKSDTIYNNTGNKIDNAEVENLIPIAKKFDDYLAKHRSEASNRSIEDAAKEFAILEHLNAKQTTLFNYIVKIAYIFEFAADTSNISAQVETSYAGSIADGENVLISNGFNSVLSPLADNVPIELNQSVYKIAYGTQGVDVYTDKNHFQANYVIVTVPLGVLKADTIQFSPKLPEQKRNAIKQLGMGTYNKIYLLFNRVFWDKQAEWLGYLPSTKNKNDLIDILNYYKFSNIPALLVFTAGKSGTEIEQWDDKSTLTHVMSILKKMYGANIPEPSSYVITRWNSEPYTRGAYSYLPVGVNKNAFSILAAPVMNQVFFAGEATSTTDPATTHGAYLSGLRAANEILALQKKKIAI